MMKKLIYSNLFILFLFANSLFAQTAGWDSTYRPKNTEQRLADFAKDPIKKGDIVFLGNSITQGGGDWNKILGTTNVHNRGISGDITFGVLDRLDEIINSKPSKIFILIGINDISRNIPDAAIIQNHKRIVERIRKGSPKTKIYFQTLMPVNSSFAKFPNHYNKDEHIYAVNDAIRNMSGKKIQVVDLYQAFLDPDKHLRADLTKDGLHLIPEGYQVWKDFLYKNGYLK